MMFETSGTVVAPAPRITWRWWRFAAPAGAAAWLDRHGDPNVCTDIDRDGRIPYRHVGPLGEDLVAKSVIPAIERSRR